MVGCEYAQRKALAEKIARRRTLKDANLAIEILLLSYLTRFGGHAIPDTETEPFKFG